MAEIADHKLQCSAVGLLRRAITLGVVYEKTETGAQATVEDLIAHSDAQLVTCGEQLKAAGKTVKMMMEEYRLHVPGCDACIISIENFKRRKAEREKRERLAASICA